MINQIHHGDCVNLMAQLPAGSIDLTVTSPPYDGLRTYNGYSFDFEAVAAELYRVTKPGGVVVWVVNDATVKGSETGTSFRQALHFVQCGFNLHDTMIWAKADAPPQTKVGRRYTSATEYMFVFSKGRIATFNPINTPCKGAGNAGSTGTQRSINGILGTRRDAARAGRTVNPAKPLTNIWSCATQGAGATHPAQFPEKLAADHILSWSNPGDTVLDPFSGSGTTAKMSAMLKRNYVGCEISAEYVTIARARVASLQTTFTF